MKKNIYGARDADASTSGTPFVVVVVVVCDNVVVYCWRAYHTFEFVPNVRLGGGPFWSSKKKTKIFNLVTVCLSVKLRSSLTSIAAALKSRPKLGVLFFRQVYRSQFRNFHESPGSSRIKKYALIPCLIPKLINILSLARPLDLCILSKFRSAKGFSRRNLTIIRSGLWD